MTEEGFSPDPGVPPELREAIDRNVQLKAALQESGMPTDFQAMVLGLATLRQVNSRRRRARR